MRENRKNRTANKSDVEADRFTALGQPPASSTSTFRSLRWVLPLFGTILVGILLYVGKPILLPLVLATLLAFLLSPMCEWMERRKVPRVMATVAVVGLAAMVLVGIVYAFYSGITQIGSNVEMYGQRIADKAKFISASNGDSRIDDSIQAMENITKAVAGDDAEGDDEAEAPPTTAPATAPATIPANPVAQAVAEFRAYLEAQNELSNAIEPSADLPPPRGSVRVRPLFVQEIPQSQTPIDRLTMVLTYAAGPLGTLGLLTVFLLFILLQRDDLRDRLIKLTAGTRINLATQAIDDAARRISRYLRAQCIINGSYGVVIGLGLTAISYGVSGHWFPGVILWAILCFALRFIPYLGPWLAAAFPVLVSLGHYDGYTVFLWVLGLFIVVELISNNVMEPMLYGQSVGMSEFAIIIAAAVWTFLWGPEGLLVATPLTTCLVVLGKYVPQLKFFDILLGDEPVLSPHSRLYQRLLAMDADDAADVAEAYRAEHTLTETFDNVLLPALALAEYDREAGNLSMERSDFIRQTMRELVDQLSEQEEPLPSDSVDLTDPNPLGVQQERLRESRVVLLPASDDADETAARMLKVLLDRRGFTVTVVDDDTLASEKLAQVVSQRADVVLISALPPRAVGRARYLVKRLDACGVRTADDVAVLVGLWTVTDDSTKLQRRICGTGTAITQVRVLSDLETAAEAIRQRAEVITTRRAATVTANSN